MVLATPMAYPSFLDQASNAFAMSPVAAQLGESIEAQNQGWHERLSQSPFTVGLGANGTWYQPYPNIALGGDPRRTFAFDPSATILYQPRSGFAATVVAGYTFARLQTPTTYLSPTQPFNLALNVSYDLIQGGLHSTLWLQARASAAQVAAQHFAYDQQTIDAKSGFLALMTDLYTADCKIGLLDDMRRRIEDMLTAARIQLRTRTMSQRDFLNFANLESNFATQLVELQANRAALSEQARAYGSAAWTLDAALAAEHSICHPDVDASVTQARAKIIATSELDAWAQALPATLSAVATQESTQLTALFVRKSNLPHLSPFVNAQMGQPDFSAQAIAQVTAGLSFDWNIPGARGGYAEREAQHNAAAARAQADGGFLSSRSVLRQLNAQLYFQAQVLDVLKKSLANSDLLLRTLEAQKAIGQVDSLNFTTAYLDNVAVQESLLDAWGFVQKATITHDLYERWVKAAGPRGPR